MSAPRILVADDDSWILRMVTTVLEKRGYVVDIAHDGEEAYEKALANKPDLLITDVMMPKMDGWTLIRALRARPEFAFIPVIFLTALSSDDDRIRGFRLGADDYLPKPFRFEELDLRVAKTIKRSAMMERATREQISSPSHVTPDQQTGPISAAAAKPTLAGNLRQVGLSALLTLLEMERKSGILVVSEAPASGTPASGGSNVGRIVLHNGRCMRARIDGKDEPKNEHCIYYMLEWSAGHFEFQEVPVETTPEISAASTTHILMEGARLIDERNAG
jgi:DNA-binding response OmpR family regulator